jgi:hypothetical protein
VTDEGVGSVGTGVEGAAAPLRLYLHVGVHKTGSTSLQVRFFKHADVLKQHGVLYPLGRFADFAYQHSAIVELLPPERRGELDALLRGVHEETVTSGCHAVVLSGENISVQPEAHLVSLRDALRSAGFSPVVVIFFRPYLDHTRSLISEQMKGGRIYITPSRIAGRLRHFSDTDTFARFASVFGADSVVRHDLAEGEDSVALFDADIGLDAALPSRRVNTRIDFATLSWLNAIKAELDVPVGLPQRLYARIFPSDPPSMAAEAAMLAEVARLVGGEKGELLDAEMQKVEQEGRALDSIEAQLEYLKRFDRFIRALRRHMKRRAFRRKFLGGLRRKRR